MSKNYILEVDGKSVELYQVLDAEGGLAQQIGVPVGGKVVRFDSPEAWVMFDGDGEMRLAKRQWVER